MPYNELPPELKAAYIANAKVVINEATDPVVNILGELAIEEAQSILQEQENSYGPAAQAERVLEHNTFTRNDTDQELNMAAYQNNGTLNDKAHHALAGNFSELDPRTQNQLFEAGFIGGKGQTIRTPETLEDVSKVANALQTSHILSEQIAAKSLEYELGAQLTDQTPDSSKLSPIELARLAELDNE